MIAPPELAAVKLLALSRLLAASDKGETRAKMSADIEPLVDHRWDATSWADRLDRVLDESEATGWIDRVRDKKGKPTAKLVLTDEGRRVALEGLGIPELPPRTTWAKIKSTYLPALALGHPGPDAAGARYLAGAPGLRAEILREKYALDLGEHPTPKAVADATAAKLLGLEPGQPFNKDRFLAKLLHDAGLDLPAGAKLTATAIQNALLAKLLHDSGLDMPAKAKLTDAVIQEALFRRELGDGDGRAGKPLERLAAQAVGATQNSAAGLSAAVLRSWIDRSEGSPATTDEAAIAEAADQPDGLDLKEFARRVVEAAQDSPSGWFGDAKVFIAHVWRALGDDPDFRGMDVSAFKGRLVEAHRARLLELGRADLVEAMDPADVAESATPYLNAVYHFVRTEEPAR